MRHAVVAGMVALLLAASAGAEEIFECLLEPHKRVGLSSAVPGLLESVSVERGDPVRRGQVVARLVSGRERAAWELARARREFAERKVKRNEELYAKKLISIHEKDEIETEALLARFEEREAREQLALRTVRSPLDGIVVERHASEGEFVRDEPIVEIAQIDPLDVEVIVPVAWFGRIREGMRGRVRPELAPEREVEAEVVRVDPVVDAASGTIRVRLELPNPGGALPSGVRCRVSFDLPNASPVGRSGAEGDGTG